MAATAERERLRSLGDRRSPQRSVMLNFRTSAEVMAQVTAAAKAAGMTRTRWLEERVLAACPATLDEVEEQRTA